VLLMIAALSQASLVISNPNIITDVLKIYPVMKDCGIKTIACNHYYYFLPTWSPWLYPIMAERLSYLKDATVAIWLTTFNANAYALHNRNGVIMPNPNTFDPFDDGSPQASGNIVLCVGRFYDSIKRLDRVLKVFKLVHNQKPDAKLVLVGGYNLNLKIPASSSETINELLERLDFPQDAVVFVGEKDQVTDYYQKASVLVMTSDNEGFPLVLTEAGSNGVPSVIFNIPGLEDIITDGANGFVVEQDDLKGMAEKVVKLLSDDELRLSIGQNAREMSMRFDRKVICNRWSDLIDLVLSAKNTAALEKQLNECFMIPPKDLESFTKTMAQEYEKGVRTVIRETYLKETASIVVEKEIEKIVTVNVPGVDLTEKEYRLLTILRRIKNVPLFHHLYVDLVKPLFRAARKFWHWLK
jgi:glycosyltransferase involved in cell wall biosynthesis